MKRFKLTIARFVAGIILTLGLTVTDRRLIANLAEGVHAGALQKKADAAITTRFLFVKKGSDDDHIAVCTADTDKPIGICIDEPSAAEEIATVHTLGCAPFTRKITLGGTVAVGDEIQVDSNSKGKKLSTSTGTYYICGRALMAGVSGDIIEIDPYPAIQRVVP